eukprot:2629252-Prymnesium_polylepis.1
MWAPGVAQGGHTHCRRALPPTSVHEWTTGNVVPHPCRERSATGTEHICTHFGYSSILNVLTMYYLRPPKIAKSGRTSAA